jgi:nucleoside-diphosphate-sugar epimerase
VQENRGKVRAVTAKHLRLSIIQGDVFQPADVQQAVEGQDAIICTIGGHDAFRGSSQTGQQGLCTIGTKHILASMEQSNVARFICLSSWGVGDSKERIPFLFARIIFPLMMKADFLVKQLTDTTFLRRSVEISS